MESAVVVDKKALKAEAKAREAERVRQYQDRLAAEAKAAQDHSNKIASERKAAIEIAPVRFSTIVWAIVVGNLISGLIAAIIFAIINAK